MKLIHLSEGLRMFKRARIVNKHGFKRYDGNLEQIIRQIIESCWNGKYFQVSSGHFNEFYCRDFGMCAEALVKLGPKERVIKTLDYALTKFRKHGRITTSISPKGKCFNFLTYGADSLPFIIHSIHVADAKEILNKFKTFLNREIDYYHENVFDAKAFLVKEDRNFSSIKDHAKRSSSCYSNCMLYMLSTDLAALGFKSSFPDNIIRDAILKKFWSRSGNFFYDDLTSQDVVTGDANTFPFWCGVAKSKKRFKQCIESMEKAGLTKPFPLKYTTEQGRIHDMHLIDRLSGGYERDSIWMHLGLCFLDVIKQFDKKRFKRYMEQYEKLIMRHMTFLELYDRKGRPFKSRIYVTDESMLWAAKYLTLKK
ncbi:hypothetical protein KY349_03610 [Candidatus Woesearchaeota archaeon]|nr:hypothetical protein [Candidatus Woesearchaeota archaeon]